MAARIVRAARVGWFCGEVHVMATLVLDDASFDPGGSPSSGALRNWLNGSWAVLFSHSEHFSPDASTPKGYLTCLGEVLGGSGIKLLELSSGDAMQSWIEDSDPARCRISLREMNDNGAVDLQARTLIKKIEQTVRPFVIVLDQHANCRTTVRYRPENIVRPRTLEDLIGTINVLRRETGCGMRAATEAQGGRNTKNTRRNPILS